MRITTIALWFGVLLLAGCAERSAPSACGDQFYLGHGIFQCRYD